MIDTELELLEYIRSEHVVFLDEESQESALKSLISEAHGSGDLKDPQGFYKAIWQREEIISTGIGMGLAIPHAKVTECSDFFIVIGIHQGEGIDWNSIDGVKVKLIFLIGGPKPMHREYLTLLSQLTQVIKDESLRQNLILAKDEREVVKIFQNC